MIRMEVLESVFDTGVGADAGDAPREERPERSCYTCAHSPPWPTPGCSAMCGDEEEDAPLLDYCDRAGLHRGFPLDRTIDCPGHAPRGATP